VVVVSVFRHKLLTVACFCRDEAVAMGAGDTNMNSFTSARYGIQQTNNNRSQQILTKQNRCLAPPPTNSSSSNVYSAAVFSSNVGDDQSNGSASAHSAISSQCVFVFVFVNSYYFYNYNYCVATGFEIKQLCCRYRCAFDGRIDWWRQLSRWWLGQ
jgi:hypothetical protein